ncbi:MAG: hypothetical protein SF028_11060 [Candidatus Sumerlaeia bacterium]|nr:hypothetical protein [Candidatus Sumerlaeia bacterium]
MELLRLFRSARWRGLALASAGLAAAFSWAGSFGEGASVFAPGGPVGLIGACLVGLLAGLVFGVDAVGARDRHRAERLLESRLLQPLLFTGAQWLAALVGLAAPIALYLLWQTAGAWRGGLEVLWTPPLVFLFAVALPLAGCGVAAGIMARCLVRSDVASVGIAAAAVLPAVWFRLEVSEPLSLMSRSSLELGLLEPAGRIWADAVVAWGCALWPLGVAGLLLPRWRGRTPVAGGSLGRLSRLATVRRVGSALGRIPKSRGAVGLAVSLVLMAAGGEAARRAATSPRFRPESPIDWARLRQPDGAQNGRVHAATILEREITLADNPRDAFEVRLALRGTVPGQRVAALTFGPGHRLAALRVETGSVGIFAEQGGGAPDYWFLSFDPPLEPDSERFLVAQVRATSAGMRRWERAYHPAFRSFAGTPDWWGESPELLFPFQEARLVRQAAPFAINLPEAPGLRWVAGNATPGPGARGGRLVQERPGTPASLVAAALSEWPGPEGALPTRWLLQPHRGELGAKLNTVYGEQLRRLTRTFGVDVPGLVFYEVPEQSSVDPLALPSPLLDQMEAMLPMYDHWQAPSAARFDASFAAAHRRAVRELVSGGWEGFEDPALLRDAMTEYLHSYALGGGGYSGLLNRARRDVAFVPWPILRSDRRAAETRSRIGFGGGGQRGGRGGWGQKPQQDTRPKVALGYDPFQVRESDAARFLGPLDPALRPDSMAEPGERRRLAFIHMLRGFLGEDRFERFIRETYGAGGGGTLTMARFRELAERHSPEPLGWLFDQFHRDGALPRLRVIELQCFLADNPETRVLEYRTRVEVANLGTGLVPVPYELSADKDAVRGTVWLGPGERRELNITTLDRPQQFALDPESWLLNQPEFAPGDQSVIRPQVVIKSVTELK